MTFFEVPYFGNKLIYKQISLVKFNALEKENQEKGKQFSTLSSFHKGSSTTKPLEMLNKLSLDNIPKFHCTIYCCCYTENFLSVLRENFAKYKASYGYLSHIKPVPESTGLDCKKSLIKFVRVKF